MTDSPERPLSVSELLTALAHDTGVLIRQEVTLASAEMTIKARVLLRNCALIAAGGALALCGFLALMSAGVTSLHAVLPWWASMLVVGVVVIGVGYSLIGRGLSALKRMDPLPEHAVEALRADVSWAKEQIR